MSVNDKQSVIEREALALSAEGPDMYPFGFYLHLAQARSKDRRIARLRDYLRTPGISLERRLAVKSALFRLVFGGQF